MKRKEGAGALALGAICTALSLVMLYIAVLAPTGRLGLVAAAGLLPAAAVISGGFACGGLSYAAAGILALVLLPDKSCALLYVAFFGLYPLLKCLIERLKKLPLEWVLKLLLFNGLFSLCYFVFTALFLSAIAPKDMPLWILYVGGNIIFVVYDVGLTKLISLYKRRVDAPLRKGRGH